MTCMLMRLGSLSTSIVTMFSWPLSVAQWSRVSPSGSLTRVSGSDSARNLSMSPSYNTQTSSYTAGRNRSVRLIVSILALNWSK